MNARSRRVPRLKATNHDSTAPNRLRYPVRKAMWMNSQTSQPNRPARRSRPAEITAWPRQM